MAFSGKVSARRVIGSIAGVVMLISPAAIASDGPQSGGDPDRRVIEVKEILPAGALVAAPAIKITTGTTLLSDGFEASFPGSVWQLYHDSSGADVDWGRSSYRKSAGSWSLWCAATGSASPGPGGAAPVNMNSWVIAGPFDLSGATSGELKFDYFLKTEANYDWFKWLASTDGTNFSGLRTSTDTTGFQTVNQSLADWGSAGSVLGQPQVWIAFIYQTDGSNSAEGAYIDQVSLTTSGGGGGNCGTYVVTSDNDNNAYSGSPDGDWGYCLYNDDPKHPIEFHFDVSESSISSAQLLLLCHDVDQNTTPGNPEIDKVYVNGSYLGNLTGANDEDSTTIFTVPSASVGPGRNRVRIDVNTNPGSQPDDWCVEIKQAQLVINGGCNGQASCRSVSTDRTSYAPGETVAVTYEVDTSAASQQVRVESNLLDPGGVIVAGAERNYTTNGSSNDPKTVNLALPSGAAAGTYTAQVLVFDGPSGRLESSCEDSFTVTGGGGGCSLSCGATVPATAQVGQTVSFAGSATPTGACGTIEYFWFPENGYSTATVFGRNATWTYNEPGTYSWLFVATGAGGARCERSGTITVTGGGGGCSLSCTASVPATAQAGQIVTLSATVTPSGNCGNVEPFWFPEQGTSSATIFDTTGSWSYSSPGTYEWFFTAISGNVRCDRRGTINITAGGGGGATTTWVPVVSRANGANNSTWRSDIGIFNPGTTTATVIIRVHVATGVISRTITLNGGGQRIITDIIGWIDPDAFTSGAVSIISNRTLIITSRTYNRFAVGAICFPTGTLGQALGGALVGVGLASGQSAWVPNLVENALFRSNIGYTNTGTTTASLTVRLFNGSGVQVGTYNVSLAPGQWKQASQPFRSVAGIGNLDAGSARITVTSGSGVFAYGSVIDNITNDPTTIPMYR
ncbi:MAG: hypothetical protein MUC56_18125 [Thermoanaerobaculales bacterium]|jgi:hypothetical protein|nr:hypothetical protein [Thermoanaerobaculales bacterium]